MSYEFEISWNVKKPHVNYCFKDKKSKISVSNILNKMNNEILTQIPKSGNHACYQINQVCQCRNITFLAVSAWCVCGGGKKCSLQWKVLNSPDNRWWILAKIINLFEEFKKHIQNKSERRDKSVFQRNTARPLVARLISYPLETLRSDVLPSQLYSPEVTSSNYDLFRSMHSIFLERNSVRMQKSGISLMMPFASK